MIILGYIFTAINYLIYCLSRFRRKKKTMLMLDLWAKILTILGLYCLGSLSGALSFVVVLCALIAANIKERLKKKWTACFILCQLLYILILIYTYQGISSALVFTTSSISLFSNWWLPPQKIRFAGGCNSIIFLTYQISIKNWAGLLELFVMFSNFASYLKYRHHRSIKISCKPKTNRVRYSSRGNEGVSNY